MELLNELEINTFYSLSVNYIYGKTSNVTMQQCNSNTILTKWNAVQCSAQFPYLFLVISIPNNCQKIWKSGEYRQILPRVNFTLYSFETGGSEKILFYLQWIRTQDLHSKGSVIYTMDLNFFNLFYIPWVATRRPVEQGFFVY